MSSRLPSALARVPLWKRQVPRYPLYYKGDPQRYEFLPLYWMKMIPPEQKVPDNYVHFIVHPQMNKSDIKQYLEKIYKVPVLSVRTELRKRNINANMFRNGIIQYQRDVVWREEEKYAYVQLREKFEYPHFFKEDGQTKNMSMEADHEYHSREFKDRMFKTVSATGIPMWFSGLRKKSNTG